MMFVCICFCFLDIYLAKQRFIEYLNLYGIENSNGKNYLPQDPINKTKYQYNNDNPTSFFKQKECEIDMLLDIDKGELKFCIVGQYDPQNEIILYNLPKIQNGWIPQFNLNGKNIELRIAQIPIQWYGIPKPKAICWSLNEDYILKKKDIFVTDIYWPVTDSDEE